jgi:ABC-type polysaccharide/polyol phosphate transport system ATPase subunit
VTARIVLSAVSKRYRKYDDTARLGGRLGQLFTRTERSWLPALSDVDLTVHPGESVGVIGRNGAGKSTLLQLLCGVTAPTTGSVLVRGRVAPLISVGVGFHPEMTGRENVYVNGTILGMTRAEIDRRFDDVVAFAELESFIDTPVKFYSSGMFVRLGFAVAVEASPDVLLVDEVLAVGDFAFQVRCFERMNAIRAAGTTIVVVSHNMSSIRGFCDRALVLHGGRIALDGTTFDAIARYHDLGSRAAGQTTDPAGKLEVLDATLLAQGEVTAHARAGDEATFRLRVRALQDIAAPFLWLGIESGQGVVVYSEARINDPMAPLAAGEEASYEIRLPLDLPTGTYYGDIALHEVLGPGRSQLLGTGARQSFYVSGRTHVHGAADLRAAFSRTDVPA